MFMDQDKFQKEVATVVGIFQDCFLNNKTLPVVKPGTQSRRFTHVQDTVNTCYEAWKLKKMNIIQYQVKKLHDYTISKNV